MINNEELILNWYIKWKKANHPFEKLIYFWISFNWFYSNYKDNLWERDIIKKVSRKQEYKDLFVILQDNLSIQTFYAKCNKKLNWIITPWIPNMPYDIDSAICEEDILINKEWEVKFSKKRIIQQYTQKNDLTQFLLIIYQIRCNLFHWNKDPYNLRDTSMVESAWIALKSFLEKLYF